MFWVIRQCLCIQNSPSVAMRRFYDMVSVEPTKIFMLGPSVSRVAIHVSIAASSWNIVQVSFSTRSSELENRNLYPFFFRTIPSDAMLNKARLQLLQHFGWSRVAIIYEEVDGNLFYSSMDDLRLKMVDDGIDIVTFERLSTDVAFTVQRLKASR
ncbi:gamma-aminobutyric acid type B receptor subunit 1-like [Pomacea canaliculata]|uniref:gamma-aminobutyric acid type B receptor subunit 1-like n=1 Tax=Pomacea canaliculata TaxID=400727 RepID=UPI000D73E993|nr:gamma-aminobutyric acid type B receptor subunit 1-like [Pomacea canaliculata]